MFVIQEGFAYLIKDDKAFKVNFSLDGKMQVSDKEYIELKDQKTYSYDEMYRKLNIRYFIQQKKNEIKAAKNANEEMKELSPKLEEKEDDLETNKEVEEEAKQNIEEPFNKNKPHKNNKKKR